MLNIISLSTNLDCKSPVFATSCPNLITYVCSKHFAKYANRHLQRNKFSIDSGGSSSAERRTGLKGNSKNRNEMPQMQLIDAKRNSSCQFALYTGKNSRILVDWTLKGWRVIKL